MPNKDKKIRRISISVANESEWLSNLIFKFNKQQKLDSNAKGDLSFITKKGDVLNMRNINRGVFSVIANFEGPGYEYWAQFRKKELKNPWTVSNHLAKISEKEEKSAIEVEIESEGFIYQ